MKTKLFGLTSALGIGGVASVVVALGAGPAAAAAGDDKGATGHVEEVVVTAQKRAENVQDVPAAISVLGADTIAANHADSLVDYAALVPGLQVDSQGSPGESQITLRGISAANAAGSTVATYIDDSPLGSSSLFAQGSSFALDLMPYDLDRIEVLRGPQGTLYGAGSVGGLLKYVTRAPDLTGFQGKFGGDVFGIQNGSGAGWTGRAMINAPIVHDQLGVRLSLYGSSTPGYVDNPVLGQKGVNKVDEYGGRASVLWQPRENLSVRLSGMWQNLDSHGPSTVTQNFVSASPRPGFLVGSETLGDLTTDTLVPSIPFKQRLQFYDATVNWDLRWATLTSASSYSRSNTSFVVDFTHQFGFLVPLFTGGAVPSGFVTINESIDLSKFTQEVRLTSPSGGRFEWLVGGFYTLEQAQQAQILRGFGLNNVAITPDPLAMIGLPSTYREYAVFGDATYRFNDRFDVTAGVRYSENRQTHTQSTTGPVTGDSSVFGASDENDTTFAVSPRWHVTPHLMAYLRVASGFGPGGPNFPSPGVPSTTHSQTDISYEAGAKGDFLDRRLVIDAAVYHIDWKNVQVNCVSASGVGFNCNGPAARSDGMEFASTYTPVDRLHLGLSTAFTDARLTQDAPAIQGVKGDRLPLSPQWSASLTGDYSFPAWHDWTATVGGAYRYVGDRFAVVQSNPTTVLEPAYGSFDAHLSISNGVWLADLYAKNIGDNRGILTSFLDTDLASAPQAIRSAILQPRTVGISLDRSF